MISSSARGARTGSPFRRGDARTESPYVKIDGVKDFLIWQTFDCGQCFRFDPTEDGGFDGVALGRYVRFSQPSPDRLEITGSDVADFENIWKHYLALDDDYVSIRAGIAESTADAAGRPGAPDPVMGEAMRCGSGIRILHQEPWETLCSFIVSQNNNIPRIKKIIAAMSEKYGEPLNAGGETYYAFPTRRGACRRRRRGARGAEDWLQSKIHIRRRVQNRERDARFR